MGRAFQALLKMIKVDLHIHTKYSPDANIDPLMLAKYCQKYNILPAITDHNRLKVKMRNAIMGEEIMTKEGEIIGLFLNEGIRPHLSIEETLDRIREQDALVLAPHPFDIMRHSTLKRHDFKMDIIEVFNSRVIFQKFNRRANEFANRNNIIKTASSDAHFLSEVGSSYAYMDEFHSKKEFLQNLSRARLVMRKTPNLNKVRSMIIKWKKRA